MVDEFRMPTRSARDKRRRGSKEHKPLMGLTE